MNFSHSNSYREAIARIVASLDVTAASVRPEFPLAADDTGTWMTDRGGRWAGGFWVGMLWLAHHYTGELRYATMAREWMSRLAPRIAIGNVLNGMVFYYGAALSAQLVSDAQARSLALDAALALDRMYHPATGVFPLGGDTTEVMTPGKIETNVDGLAAMTLLLWSADALGDESLRQHALSNIRRVADACQRADGSFYQTASFDPLSGDIERRFTPRGYSEHSTWARAQSWALLGLVQATRRDAAFAPAALEAAEFWMARTTTDPVAFWDFDDPSIPAVERDTSATAMAASALYKLGVWLTDGETARLCTAHAKRTIDALLADYLTPVAPHDQRPVGMLTQGCWQRNQNLAPRHELIWGDYFLLEALLQFEGQLIAV